MWDLADGQIRRELDGHIGEVTNHIFLVLRDLAYYSFVLQSQFRSYLVEPEPYFEGGSGSIQKKYTV